jgi:hypothetical protein
MTLAQSQMPPKQNTVLVVIVKVILVLFAIGLVVGSIILMSQPGSNWLVSGMKAAIVVILLCLVIGLIIWIISPFGMASVTSETWVRTLLHIAGMMLIIGIALQREHDDGWSAVLYWIILGIFSFVVLLSLREQYIEWLKPLWNTAKGLGGGAFGDFAGAVGILAGVGAYQLQDASDGWFWLGQCGAFLAMLIGLSLSLRWIRQDDWKKEDKEAPCFLFTHWWYAHSTVAAGALTFMSMITQTASVDPIPPLRQTAWLFWLQLIFIIILVLVVAFSLLYYFRRIYELGRNKVGDKFQFPCLALRFDMLNFLNIFWTAAAGILLVWVYTSDTIFCDWASSFFGSWATLIGVLIEFGILWTAGGAFWDGSVFKDIQVLHPEEGEVVNPIRNWKEPLKIMRGVDIILGNLALFVLVLWIAFWDPQATDYNPVQWFLFCGAIVLMTQASLGGIILSTHDVARRRKQEEDAKRAAGSPSQPPSSVQMTTIATQAFSQPPLAPQPAPPASPPPQRPTAPPHRQPAGQVRQLPRQPVALQSSPLTAPPTQSPPKK